MAQVVYPEAFSTPKEGTFGSPSKALALRGTMFAFSSLTIAFAPFVIFAAFLGSVIHSDGGGFPSSSYTASYVGAAIGIAAGIYEMTAGVLAAQSNVLIWTIFGWVFFLAIGAPYLYLILLGDMVMGPVVCLFLCLFTHLVSCTCCSYMMVINGLKPLHSQN